MFVWVAQQCLQDAKELEPHDENVEALLRTTVSRAYYAAYHSLLDFLAPQWVPRDGHGEHSEAIRALEGMYAHHHSTPKWVNGVVRNLKRLKHDRVFADYDRAPERRMYDEYLERIRSTSAVETVMNDAVSVRDTLSRNNKPR